MNRLEYCHPDNNSDNDSFFVFFGQNIVSFAAELGVNLHFMKVSTEIDNNFGYEQITQLVDNIPLRSVLLIFLVFCVLLLCFFTFWVPCCDFRIQTMFASSLPPVVCKRARNLNKDTLEIHKAYVVVICIDIV